MQGDMDHLLSEVTAAHDLGKISTAVEAINALGPQQDVLPRLLAANPNAYVYALQASLRDGGYAAPLNAILDRSTLDSVIAFCTDNDIASICARGPLLPESAMAIGAVLAKQKPAAAEPKPAAAAPPEASAPQASSTAADASSSTLPDGWSIDDLGTVGIQPSIVAATPGSATIRFEGVAALDGWANIYFSPPVQVSAPAHWRISLASASAESANAAAQSVRLLAARQGPDGNYLGELFEGIALEAAPKPMEGTGAVPEGTTQLRPYVQMRFVAGQPVAMTLSLEGPVVEALD